MRTPVAICPLAQRAPSFGLGLFRFGTRPSRFRSSRRFHFAEEGFQTIERDAFVFVIGDIEIEILPYFTDKILCLICHVAGPREMIRAPEQGSSERILFALVIRRIKIVIRFGCLVDDARNVAQLCTSS